MYICLMFYLCCCRRCYIRFIRKANDKKGPEGQEETKKAFDFMLNYVGWSYHSSLLDIIDDCTVLLCILLRI